MQLFSIFMRQYSGRSVLMAGLSLLLLVYFCYHYVSGSRGLLAYNDMQGRADALDVQLQLLQKNNAAIMQRVTLLRRDSIDQDMLDEQARALLGYSSPDEKVIPVPLKQTPPAPAFQ